MFPLRTFRLALMALTAAACLLAAAPLDGLTQEATPAAECVETTPEENAELAALYWQEAVWGEQGTIAEIVAPDEVHHWGIAGTTEGFDELPGLSVFCKDAAGNVFHTYSSYARGNEEVIGTFIYLDITPKGRDETEIMDWVRRHDEYEDTGGPACCSSTQPAKAERGGAGSSAAS